MIFFNPLRTAGKFAKLVCTFGALAVVLMIAGIVMLSAATTPTRELAIEKYNKAVEAWSTSIRPNFTSGQFAVSIGASNASSSMQAQTSGDSLKDSDLKTLKTYEQLFFVTIASLISTGPYKFSLSPPSTVSFSVSEFPSTVTDNINMPDCRQTDSECSGITDSDRRKRCNQKPTCSSACTNRGGVWTGSVCYVTMYLRKICILVKKTGDSWVPAKDDRMSNGCYYESAGVGSGSQYTKNYPATYAKESGQVQLEVRHEEDPYVVASQITEGTYTFGLSQAQKAKIGAGLLASGGVMMALIVGGFVLSYKCFRKVTKDNNLSAVGVPVAVTTHAATPTPGYNPASYGNPYYANTPAPYQPESYQPAPYQPAPSAPYAQPYHAENAYAQPPSYSAQPEAVSMPEPSNFRDPK